MYKVRERIRHFIVARVKVGLSVTMNNNLYSVV